MDCRLQTSVFMAPMAWGPYSPLTRGSHLSRQHLRPGWAHFLWSLQRKGHLKLRTGNPLMGWRNEPPVSAELGAPSCTPSSVVQCLYRASQSPQETLAHGTFPKSQWAT